MVGKLLNTFVLGGVVAGVNGEKKGTKEENEKFNKLRQQATLEIKDLFGPIKEGGDSEEDEEHDGLML